MLKFLQMLIPGQFNNKASVGQTLVINRYSQLFYSLYPFIQDHKQIIPISAIILSMVHIFFKSKVDRCSFKKRVNKKIIVRLYLSEDLVCY